MRVIICLVAVELGRCIAALVVVLQCRPLRGLIIFRATGFSLHHSLCRCMCECAHALRVLPAKHPDQHALGLPHVETDLLLLLVQRKLASGNTMETMVLCLALAAHAAC